MSIEGSVYPIWEEIDRKRNIGFNLRKRIANGETDLELLKQYFRAERDFRQWAYGTVDPNNPYHGQKIMEQEAKEFDNLLQGGSSVWAAFCGDRSKSIKKWTKTHNVQGERKETAEAEANNWSQLAAKIREG